MERPDGISLNAAVCTCWVQRGSGPGAIKQKVPLVTRSTSERRRTISAFRFFAWAHGEE